MLENEIIGGTRFLALIKLWESIVGEQYLRHGS